MRRSPGTGAPPLQNAGRLPEALTAIERARSLDPTSTALLVDDGLLLYLAGRRAEARLRLDRVVAIDPTNADAHRYLGEIARNEGRVADSDVEWQLFANFAGCPSSSLPRPARSIRSTPQPTEPRSADPHPRARRNPAYRARKRARDR